MKVAGIDPGLAFTGWAVLEGKEKNIKLIDCGCIKTKNTKPLHFRLKDIYDKLYKVFNKYKLDAVSIESQFFYGKVSSKNIYATNQARGIVLLLCAQKNIEVFEYSPKIVKISVSGYGNASKQQIQRMINCLLNLNSNPKYDDISDAIALAYCHFQSNRIIYDKIS